jgi:hypothetical protein
MGNMNLMKKPLLPYIRQDGRSVLTTDCLQFVPDSKGANDAAGSEILEPGLIVGAVIRCHWFDFFHHKYAWETDAERSTRIHFSGVYTGETRDVDYYTGDRVLHTAPAPIFEMNAWRWRDGLQMPIGLVAVAYLAENEPAGIYGVDSRSLHKALPHPEEGNIPTPKTVQIGGLYYVPPGAPARASEDYSGLSRTVENP